MVYSSFRGSSGVLVTQEERQATTAGFDFILLQMLVSSGMREMRISAERQEGVYRTVERVLAKQIVLKKLKTKLFTIWNQWVRSSGCLTPEFISGINSRDVRDKCQRRLCFLILFFLPT